MYPINPRLDKSNCLSSLVGLRTSCKAGTMVPPFFIEDIEGFDIEKLAALAMPSAPTGQDLANQVVGSAAREMMGDIELLVQNGYSLQSVVGSQCSSCTLLPVYTSNTGIKIKTVVPSSYQVLRITDLNILTNTEGQLTFIIDDGETQKRFTGNFVAGQKTPVKIQYETSKREVSIYFEDSTVGLGRVNCPTTSSCGCGGGQNVSPVAISGLVGGADNAVQYGFIPCATVACSYDALVCSLINGAPNIFGLALLYKIGEKLTVIKSQNQRNNEASSFQDSSEVDLNRNFGQLYWAKMQGGNNKKGIKHLISDYLFRQKSDKCIVCDNKFYSAGARG